MWRLVYHNVVFLLSFCSRLGLYDALPRSIEEARMAKEKHTGKRSLIQKYLGPWKQEHPQNQECKHIFMKKQCFKLNAIIFPFFLSFLQILWASGLDQIMSQPHNLVVFQLSFQLPTTQHWISTYILEASWKLLLSPCQVEADGRELPWMLYFFVMEGILVTFVLNLCKAASSFPRFPEWLALACKSKLNGTWARLNSL